MKILEFKGPYSFEGDESNIDNIDKGLNGIYLWCFSINKDLYRVYYVGETTDIRYRNRVHRGKQLAGDYSGHCIESIKKNIKIIKHRAREGMIERFSHENAKEFNKSFLANVLLFYAEVHRIDDKKENKINRCRYETAVVRAIEDNGQNVLHIGQLRIRQGGKEKVQVKLPSGIIIEALEGVTLQV